MASPTSLVERRFRSCQTPTQVGDAWPVSYTNNAHQFLPALQSLDTWPNNRLTESSHRENTPCLEGEAVQSPGPQREESPFRENTPWLDAASHSDDFGGQHVQSRTGGASDDEVALPRAISQSKRNGRSV